MPLFTVKEENGNGRIIKYTKRCMTHKATVKCKTTYVLYLYMLYPLLFVQTRKRELFSVMLSLCVCVNVRVRERPRVLHLPLLSLSRPSITVCVCVNIFRFPNNLMVQLHAILRMVEHFLVLMWPLLLFLGFLNFVVVVEYFSPVGIFLFIRVFFVYILFTLLT